MGHQSAEFAAFYESARDDCLRAVAASLGDRQAAEDVVAEAFARAWASWPTVARHPAPRAWVVRTALNAHTSWWRRWRREIPAPAAPEHDRAGHDAPDDLVPDPSMMAALRTLPTRQRQVIALRVFLDLDSRATARALGIAEGTVTAHLARATRTLRAQLTPAAEQEAQP